MLCIRGNLWLFKLYEFQSLMNHTPYNGCFDKLALSIEEPITTLPLLADEIIGFDIERNIRDQRLI